MPSTKQPERNEQEIAKIRDDAIRRALNTPPKPYKDSKVGGRQSQCESRLRRRNSA